MTENSVQPKVIIVMIQHPLFGPLLIPYMAQDMPDGTILLLEQAFHAPKERIRQMNNAEQKAIQIASRYSEKNLMKVYSKEKATSSFLKKLTEETLNQVIRPFIQRKLVEMAELIRENNLPVYQNNPGNKVLYKHNSYQISPAITETSFVFEADEKVFRYSLSCTREGKPVLLQEKKPVIVLATSPAVLLTGNELHIFRNIHASRIIPFTHKTSVSVDIAQLDKYLENIVLPIIPHHNVSLQGIPAFEEYKACEAHLSVRAAIYEQPVLELLFVYGDKTFYPGKPFSAKHAWSSDENGKKVIWYFHRDKEKEERLMRLLTDSGLQLVSDSCYKLSEKAPVVNLTEWIDKNKSCLKENFRLTDGDKEAEYCLDEIHVEEKLTETNDWFELHMTVSIGSLQLPFVHFRKHILDGNRKYLLPDGKIILLPQEWFNKYSDLLEFSDRTQSGIKVKQLYSGVVSDFLDTKKKQVSYESKQKNKPPGQLKATLRNYQQEGFNWMIHLHKHKLNGCLADDMGLGKTLQTLSLLQYIYSKHPDNDSDNKAPFVQPASTDGQLSLFQDESPDEETTLPASLIVVPTSLLHNWRKETGKFTALRIFEYTGSAQLKPQQFAYTFGHFHLVLTSYGIMRNYTEDLSRYTFEYIVLDESQHIKNSDSQTFKAVKRLRSNHRLILTGTPIENSLKDLWSQFNFIQAELLGSENNFQKQFINPIKQGDERIEKRLASLIKPFILRRSKQEVAPELPSLTEEVFYCGMTDEQDEIYKTEKNRLRNTLLEHSLNKNRHNNLTVLNGIMLLRQLACHPAMVYPEFTGDSGKTEEILSIFDTLQSEGHKVLIFSSFVKHLDILASRFSKHGWKYSMLTGSTLNREQEIERFNYSDDIKAFFISLKAGGTGLNLTQADYVFIIDPWWNPAAEIQAISRAHRIGQNKNVMAYRFITQYSIEEKIIRLQENKRKLSEAFVTESNPFEQLTDEEWAKLLEN